MIKKIQNLIKYNYTSLQLVNRIKYDLNKRKRSRLNYRPLWILLYLTDLCNLHCAMCPHHTIADSSQFKQKKVLNNDYMSIEIVKKVLAMFPESYYVMLAGVGEPLMHPKFKQIVKTCAKAHKKIKIVTNGTLLNDEISEFIIKEKSIEEIQISLNAPNWKVYHSICGGSKDEYYSLLKKIKNLVALKRKYKSRVKISLSAVCSNEFKPYSKSFLMLCDSLNVDEIAIFRYIDFNIIGNHCSALSSDISFVNDLRSFAQKHIKSNYSLPHIANSTSFKNRCDWYWKNISIDSKGNIGSCGRVISPDVKYGSIFDSGDVWNNQYFCRTRKQILSGSKLPSECCKTCVENNYLGARL